VRGCADRSEPPVSLIGWAAVRGSRSQLAMSSKSATTKRCNPAAVDAYLVHLNHRLVADDCRRTNEMDMFRKSVADGFGSNICQQALRPAGAWVRFGTLAGLLLLVLCFSADHAEVQQEASAAT